MTPRSKLFTTAVLGFAALTLAVGPTLAQGMGMGRGMGMGMGNPDAPWRARFAQIDTNGDGVVFREELKAQAAGVFGAMDVNDDGQITLEEYKAVRMGPQRGWNPERQAAMQARKVARFAPMDTNRDGKVSRDEFLAFHGDTLFARMDADRDGKVTPAEFRRHGW